jgi:hypothetical protein
VNGILAPERRSLAFAGIPVSVVTAVGLGLVAIVAALAVLSNAGLYLVGAMAAVFVLYLILKHPTAVTYVALAWLVFEKSAGPQTGSLASLLSVGGDALLVFALFWAIVLNLMRGRRPVFRPGLIGWGLLAFIALSIASTISNGVPLHVAELGLIDTLKSLLIFLAIINIGISARDVNRAVYWIIGVMAVAALLGVLQVYAHSPAWIVGGQRFAGPHGLMRVDGPFDHPLSLGNYLALTAPLALMLRLFGNVTGRWRGWLTAACYVFLLGLLFTFAREAWLAIPVSMVFVGLTVDWKVLKVIIPPVLMMGLVAIPFVSSVNATDTGAQRLTIFKLALPLIKTHLLLGAGPGRFGGHVALITHTPLYALYHVSNYFYGTGNQIDQFWTHLLAEAGILGVAAFLAMIVPCFLLGRTAYRRSSDPRRRAIILGLLCAVPSAILLSFTSSTLEEGPAATLFWAQMGLLTVLALAGDAEPASDPAHEMDGGAPHLVLAPADRAPTPPS